MDDIDKACEELQVFLDDWYPTEVERVQKDSDASLSQIFLAGKKKEFMDKHPEYKHFDDFIFVDYKVVDDSYKPGCLNGCCSPFASAKSNGVVVNKISKEELKLLAGVANGGQ